jgi:hypothetical protein
MSLRLPTATAIIEVLSSMKITRQSPTRRRQPLDVSSKKRINAKVVSSNATIYTCAWPFFWQNEAKLINDFNGRWFLARTAVAPEDDFHKHPRVDAFLSGKCSKCLGPTARTVKNTQNLNCAVFYTIRHNKRRIWDH